MEWISVKDRLPAIDSRGASEDVLIAIRYGYDEPSEPYTICCGYLSEYKWWSYSEHDCHKVGEKTGCNFNPYEGDKVEYWMPLPEAPQPCGQMG